MNKRRLVVCDYDNPHGYTFPNFDMGSSEKRLWHFAKSASELPDVVLFDMQKGIRSSILRLVTR